MRMDLATVGGIAAGIFVVGLAIAMGGAVSVFFNLPSFSDCYWRRCISNNSALSDRSGVDGCSYLARARRFLTIVASRVNF